MTAIGDLLRLAAALHTWDAVLRSHLIERMKQNCGSAWEAGILRSLHEDRQLEYHQYGDRRPDLRHYLEIREFYWIARGNRRYFGEFTNRDLSHIADATRIRNEFAHFYTGALGAGLVARRIRLLTRLVRKVDEREAARIEELGGRIGAALDESAGPPSAELVDAEQLTAEIRASMKASLEEFGKSASLNPDALARQLAESLTPYRERHLQELRKGVESITESVDESRALLEQAREDREEARRDRAEAESIRADAERIRTEVLRQLRAANSDKAPAVPRERRGHGPSDAGRQAAGPGKTPTASSRSGNGKGAVPARDQLQGYRSRFREASSGNGWIYTTRLDDWRITCWVGMAQGETRACVFSPSKPDETGRWISAAPRALISRAAPDEDAAFELLFRAEQSGEVERLAKDAIRDYERRTAPPPEPPPRPGAAGTARGPASSDEDEDVVPF